MERAKKEDAKALVASKDSDSDDDDGDNDGDSKGEGGAASEDVKALAAAEAKGDKAETEKAEGRVRSESLRLAQNEHEASLMGLTTRVDGAAKLVYRLLPPGVPALTPQQFEYLAAKVPLPVWLCRALSDWVVTKAMLENEDKDKKEVDALVRAGQKEVDDAMLTRSKREAFLLRQLRMHGRAFVAFLSQRAKNKKVKFQSVVFSDGMVKVMSKTQRALIDTLAHMDGKGNLSAAQFRDLVGFTKAIANPSSTVRRAYLEALMSKMDRDTAKELLDLATVRGVPQVDTIRQVYRGLYGSPDEKADEDKRGTGDAKPASGKGLGGGWIKLI